MQVPLLLAFRYLRSATHEQTVSTMLKICFFSIMFCTGSLALIASIMKGFESATHKKLQGVHADLVIYTPQGSIDYPRLSRFLQKKYGHAILASSPSRTEHVIMQTAADQEGIVETAICILKAIDPETEPLVSTFSEIIVDQINSSTSSPWKHLTSKSIFIGQALAKRLHIAVGSSVTLFYQPQAADDSHLKKKKVVVAGLVKSGIHDYDEQIILAPFSLANQLYPERVTHVALSLVQPRDTQKLTKELKDVLSLDVYSWKDLYPPLVSALTLEKYAMWIILMLVTLIASLTIVALIYLYTMHKQLDIALLKAHGMSNNDLRQLFLWIASTITFTATTCGLLIAAGGVWILRTYPFIKLPDVYFVTHLPATMDLSIILGVYGIAFLVSLFSGLFPNTAVKTMNVARVLKGMGGA